MALLNELVNLINGIVWGVPMIVLILGTGLYLQIRLRFMPLRKIVHGFRMIWQGRATGAKADGEISPFAALMTALMAIPNLISLLLLSPVIVGLTREHFDRPHDERDGHWTREAERPPDSPARTTH